MTLEVGQAVRLKTDLSHVTNRSWIGLHYAGEKVDIVEVDRFEDEDTDYHITPADGSGGIFICGRESLVALTFWED